MALEACRLRRRLQFAGSLIGDKTLIGRLWCDSAAKTRRWLDSALTRTTLTDLHVYVTVKCLHGASSIEKGHEGL
jgi:hypothetical protein